MNGYAFPPWLILALLYPTTVKLDISVFPILDVQPPVLFDVVFASNVPLEYKINIIASAMFSPVDVVTFPVNGTW